MALADLLSQTDSIRMRRGRPGKGEQGGVKFPQPIAQVCIMHAAGQNVRKLVKDGFVIRKPVKIHSRARARAAQEAKSKGRHSGYGELQRAS